MADSELLDLDATVFADYWNAVLDDVAAAAPQARTIVDLGTGTGSGAVGLAARFPEAHVTAVDSSEEMPETIAAKDPRITALVADLDDGWPSLTGIDITFASMSLHHLADPERLLDRLFAATAPRGVVAVAEFSEPIRALAETYGDDVEGRALAAMRAGHPLPELQADWPTRLRAAGFEIVDERVFDLDVRPPLDGDARRYAQVWLERIARGVTDHGADHATGSDEVADVLGRATPDDLHLHGRRTLTIARKSSDA